MKLFILLLVATFFHAQITLSINCLWAERISGSGDERGYSIAVDGSGNVYVAGYFNSPTLNFNNGISLKNSGTKDAYISKYNTSGICQWSQRISGTNDDGITSVEIDSSGNVYVAGSFDSPTLGFNNGISLTNGGLMDGYLSKFNSSGICQWAQKISGTDIDRTYCIALDDTGNIYVSGNYNSSTLNFNNGISLSNTSLGYADAFIAKYNTSGTCQWAEKIYGSDHDHANSLALDGSGNIYVSGFYLSSNLNFNNGISLTNSGFYDIYIAKYNNSGTCQWAEKISGSDDDRSYSTVIDGLGNVYFVGYFTSNNLSFNNGISLTNSGQADCFISKYNSSGTCQWAEKISGTGIDYAWYIAVNNTGNVYVGGDFKSNVLSFNNGISLTNGGQADGFIAQYNSGGLCRWAEKISGTGDDRVYSIALDYLDNVYVSGWFSGSTLNFSNGISLNNSNAGTLDAFIAKYGLPSPPPKLTTNSPICEGDDLYLFVDSIPNAKYNWYGPDGFISNQQNPIIKQAKAKQSGKYYFYSTIGSISSDTLSIDIVINTSLVSPGDSSLIFVGSAAKIDSFIKLTNSKLWDGGSIWLKNRFSVKQNFTTTFRFRTRYGNNGDAIEGSLPGADGLAFVMQNHNYPVLGDKGGSMGYTGITNSLAIEFDLFENTWDPNGNHIAVQSMGSLPNIADHTKGGSCLGINDKINTIMQDSMYFAKIEYDWATKTLNVYLDETGKWESPVLTISNIDLASHLRLEEGEYVYIGFSAGTGLAYQEHDLFDWTIPCKNQLVGVDDKYFRTSNSDEMSISPNPASDNIIISFSNRWLKPSANDEYEVQIYNTLGVCVEKTYPSNPQVDEFIIDVSGLPAGLYYCTMSMGLNQITKSFALVR